MDTRHERRRVSVGFITLGCKLNQYETEGMAEAFEKLGATVVPFGEPADVQVVNTCTVTMRSDYRSRQMLRRAARSCPDALIVATGCYAQRDPAALEQMPETDLVVGNSGKPGLADRVMRHLERRRSRGLAERGTSGVFVDPLDDAPFHPYDIERFRGYTRAFLKIQDGCDRRCSYCAVPDARGPSRSREPSDVLRQAKRLVAGGHREIVLTGVHIGAYGIDGTCLAYLIRGLARIEGLDRIRLGSVEPTELTDELAEAILETSKVCRHLHVPLESGSNRILEAMRRPYTREDYARAIRRVTDHDATCGLGTDVMVGFPGETEEDFGRTLDLIEALPFSYLHVFNYSPRRGTPAADMEDQVPPDVRKKRSRLLRAVGDQRSVAFREELRGSVLAILVERKGREAGFVSGLAGNYVRVDFAGSASLANRIVDVEVVGSEGKRTIGRAVPDSDR